MVAATMGMLEAEEVVDLTVVLAVGLPRAGMVPVALGTVVGGL